MENKSVTAVEFLIQKTSNMTIHKTHLNDTISEWQDGYNVALEDVIKLLNQAIKMEKKQMLHFWQGGLFANESGGKNFETYYNETYKPSA
jgi:hypothetical protein